MSLRALAVLLAAAAAPGCMERPAYLGDLAEQGAALAGPAGARTVSVTGTGRIALAPDQVVLRCLVNADAPSPGEAWTAGAARMAQLSSVLAQSGVATTDMAVVDARLSRPVAGAGTWRLTQVLAVSSRKLTTLADLVQTIIGPGGATDVEDARFGFAEPRIAADRARERALLAARDKARQLAAELSLQLGEVLSVSELPPESLPADAVPAGRLETVVTLQVVWRLVD